MFTKNKYGGFLKKTLKAASTKEGVATIGGATAGGWFGSSVGLAGFWGGIAGTFPIAIVGGVIGYLAVKAFKKKKEKTIKEKILRTVIIAGIIIVIVAGIYFALIN
jgi:outer membrane lipoprotein SlyB|tara:strand:- start:543 stop:860 length:318 start_codon:yes stop_codon:yes gene_type:complete